MALADVITLHDEKIDEDKPYEIFDSVYTWKRKTLKNFYARELAVKIFDKGRQVYKSPDIQSIKSYCKRQIDTLWDELLRFENPHSYYVDLSQKLWDLKQNLLNEQNTF